MMMHQPRIDLVQNLKRSLGSISAHLAGSLVYLDEGAAEALRVSVGVRHLFDLGVSNVCDLETAALEDAALGLMDGVIYPALVIFTTEFLPSVYDNVTKAVQVHHKTPQITVFCSYPVDAHPVPKGQVIGTNAYLEFERAVKEALEAFIQAMPDQGVPQTTSSSHRSEVRVQYFPFLYCVLTPWSFVLPYTGAVTSTWASGEAPLGFGCESVSPVGDSSHENNSQKSEISRICNGLSGLAAHSGIKLDTFALGPTSQRIGKEIAKLGVSPAMDGSMPETPATLILIDRSLDMMAPVSHGDSFAERMIRAVGQQKQYNGSGGLKQKGRSFMQQPKWSIEQERGVPGGGFNKSNQHQEGMTPLVFRGHDSQWQRNLQELLKKKVKNGGLLVKKWLKEAIRMESLPSAGLTRAGSGHVEDLRACCNVLCNDSGVAFRHKTNLDFAQMAMCALATEFSMPQDVLHRNEQQILMTPTPEELVQVTLDLLINASKPQALLTLKDVLGLLIFMYSLRGDEAADAFTHAEEQFITNAVIDSILEDVDLTKHNWLGDHRALIKQVQDASGVDDTGYEVAALKLQLKDFLRDRFERLQYFSTSRNGLGDLRRLTGINEDYVPLVRQVSSHIFANSTLGDLTHATSLLTGLLKMGLGRFGFQNRTKPGDHPIVIIFVVGGISLLEIKEILGEMEGQSPWKPQIILGGNCLLSERDVIDIVWK